VIKTNKMKNQTIIIKYGTKCTTVGVNDNFKLVMYFDGGLIY